MAYNSVIRKKEIPPFTTPRMDLEHIVPSERSQRKKNTVQYHLHVKSKKPSSLKQGGPSTDPLLSNHVELWLCPNEFTSIFKF